MGGTAPLTFKYCGRQTLVLGFEGNPKVIQGFSLPRQHHYHAHPYFELLLHESGTGWVGGVAGDPRRFGRGVLEIWPPGSLHRRMVESPAELICLYFGVHDPVPPGLRKPVWLQNANRFVGELTLLMTAPPDRSARMQEALDYQVAALVYRILDMVETNAPSASPTFTPALRAHNLILTRFPKVGSLSAIAAEVGVSYDHLRHLFRRAYGMSMKQFLIRTQIDRAKVILVGNPQYPMKRVAELCGFSGVPHFSMCFRRATGQSPARWRPANTRHGDH